MKIMHRKSLKNISITLASILLWQKVGHTCSFTPFFLRPKAAGERAKAMVTTVAGIEDPMIEGRNAIEMELANRDIQCVHNLPGALFDTVRTRECLNWIENTAGPHISAKITAQIAVFIANQHIWVFTIDREKKEMTCRYKGEIYFDPNNSSVGLYSIGNQHRLLILSYKNQRLECVSLSEIGTTALRLGIIPIISGRHGFVRFIQPGSLKVDNKTNTFEFTTPLGNTLSCYLTNGELVPKHLTRDELAPFRQKIKNLIISGNEMIIKNLYKTLPLQALPMRRALKTLAKIMANREAASEDITNLKTEFELNVDETTALALVIQPGQGFSEGEGDRAAAKYTAEYFAQELLKWAKLPDDERAKSIIQPIWSGDNTKLGQKNERGEMITYTPQVAIICNAGVNKNNRANQTIMYEAIRRNAAIPMESEEWKQLRDILMNFETGFEKLKVLSTAADVEKRRFVNIWRQFLEATMPIIYEGMSYFESLPERNDMFMTLTDVDLLEIFDYLKLITREEFDTLGARIYVQRQTGAAFGRLKYRRDVPLAIVTYKSALKRKPDCALEITQRLAELALSKEGREASADGKRLAMLADEVASGLGEPVLGEFRRMTTPPSLEKLKTPPISTEILIAI